MALADGEAKGGTAREIVIVESTKKKWAGQKGKTRLPITFDRGLRKSRKSWV